MKIIFSFATYHGRIDRTNWLLKLTLLALICIAFGMFFLYLIGNAGAALFSFLFLWCAAALSIQRLHDVGHSSWILLAFLIPVIGPLLLLSQLLRRGSTESNQFGTAPIVIRDYLNVDISR